MTASCGWLDPPSSPRLAAAEVHVWCAPLDLPQEEVERLAATLSAGERNRAARMRIDRHRARFIASRARLRAVLAGYLDVAAEQVPFSYGPQGKPVLGEPWGAEQLHFNLSNSQGLALVAVGRDAPLGIDVEHVRPVASMEQIVARHFSSAEKEAWDRLRPEARRPAFFLAWTCKEAVLKALGTGLTVPLNRIRVALSPEGPARLLALDVEGGDAAEWSLERLDPADGYVAALAVRGGPVKVTCWRIK